MKGYKPQPKQIEILNLALEIINSVPYIPSTRWAFYQIVQRGKIAKKDVHNFDHWLSRARKSFWNGWAPDTLSDSIRHAIIRGLPHPMIPAQPDRIKDQKYYVELWFEARAMENQFWYYTKEYYVTMVPFGGDASIAYKWEIAKRLEGRHEQYHKPIVILYFGDCDKKGFMIPESALNDIRDWCIVDFEFIRCGLTLEQAKKYRLPENPERLGQYQWEALSDEQAGELILSNLKKYWKKPY